MTGLHPLAADVYYASPQTSQIADPRAATVTRRPWRMPVLLAGVAAAVVTVVTVSLSQGSAGPASLCSDYAALSHYGQLDPAGLSSGQVADMDRLLHRIAGEAPNAARPLVAEVARDFDDQVTTGISTDPNVELVARRADAILTAACPGTGR